MECSVLEQGLRGKRPALMDDTPATRTRGANHARAHGVAVALFAAALIVPFAALLRAISHSVPSDLAAEAPFGLCVVSACLATAAGVVALWLERRGPRENTFALVRRLFCIGVVTWIGVLVFAQPFSRVRLELAIVLGAGTFSATRAIEPLFARVPRGVRRALALTAFDACLLLVLGELALRALALARPSPIFARIDGSPTELLQAAREKPGSPRFSFPCNSLGEFDDEFVPRRDGEHLVVTIGDSFSFGVVPHELHFTTLCERAIGTPVDNMGVPMIGPPEYAWLLEHEALPLRPDVIVVDVFVGNDIVFAYENTPTLDPWLRSWFDRRNVLLWIVPARLSRIFAEQKLRSSSQGPVGRPQGEQAPISVGSATLAETMPWLGDPLLETPQFSETAFAEIETRCAVNLNRATESPPRAFCDALLRMKRLAGSTPLAVMLIPDEYQIEDAVWRTVVERAGDTPLERDRAQSMLLPWFAEQGIPCLDLLPVLRATPPLADGRKHLYHLRDTHFNARGNRAAANALAEFLRRRWPSACAR
jgi:hypothetical protein